MHLPKNKYLFIVPAGLLLLACFFFLPALHTKASAQSITRTRHGVASTQAPYGVSSTNTPYGVDRHPPHHPAPWLRRCQPGSSLALTPPQFELESPASFDLGFPLPPSASWHSTDTYSLPLRGPPPMTLFL